MSAIDWFRSKRQLIADRDALEVIVAKQIDEIETKDTQIAKAAADLLDKRDRWGKAVLRERRATETEHRLRVGAEEKLAAVVAELQAFRQGIRQAEQGSNLPSATGAGMVRPSADDVRAGMPGRDRPAPQLRGGLANRPMPWQTADAIAQEDNAKRAEDI